MLFTICVKMFKKPREDTTENKVNKMRRTYSDAQAVLAIANSDPQANVAYSEVYRQYYGPLVTYASTVLRNMQGAEDIVSDVLEIRFYNNCPRLKESAVSDNLNLQAWLYRVTRNLCFNVVRDKRRRDKILDAAKQRGDPSFFMVPSEEYQIDPVSDIDNALCQNRLTHAIASLNTSHQNILELRYRRGMTHPEIATTLGIRVGTVSSRLNRAQEKLRQLTPSLEEFLAL